MKKIFVVDDDPSILHAIDVSLAPMDAEVCTFSDPFLALSASQEDPPDVVIVDMMMPKIDGVSLVKEMRKTGQSPKVVVISGLPAVKEWNGLYHNGVVKFIEKPFGIQQIRDTIHELFADYVKA